MFCPVLVWHAVAAFSAGKAAFVLKVNGQVSPYRVNGMFILPAAELTLATKGKKKYVLHAVAGAVQSSAVNTWRWQAPQQPGLYPISISQAGSAQRVILNIFVMVPALLVKEARLNGYDIGEYPAAAPQRQPHDSIPSGFIEVTQENQDTLVSPHFTLRQFLCKQDGSYPKYLVLKERLLWKLEAILQEVNRRGYPSDTFHIMSGYRTPAYNKAIGNVSLSRHLWGEAADIFIDQLPHDGMMDDLNRDGAIDQHDAAVLYKIIDDMQGRALPRFLSGGLASYPSTDFHGPFVHVDVRGQRVTWGN